MTELPEPGQPDSISGEARSAGGHNPPIEVKPGGGSSIGLWALTLGGPVVWITHFMVVYLAAEATCTAATEADFRLLDADGLTALVLATTGVAVAAIVTNGVLCLSQLRRPRHAHARMAQIGLLLAAGSLVAVLAVGLPITVIDPC